MPKLTRFAPGNAEAMAAGDPYAWLAESLATLHRADWYRSVKRLQGKPEAEIILEGQTLINFASNDYLALAADQRLIDAAIQAVQTYGTGSTGSRLITGHRELHEQLEQAIATLKQTEAALVFSSGYLANLGCIAALVGSRDLILADQYNHSSLKSGAKLSGATVLEYAHNQMDHLVSLLQQHRHHYRRCLVSTDTIFSMDGDLCPLPTILDLAAAFECMVLVDEAHATGVLGSSGAGAVEHWGCTGQNLIQVGTLSKALGSLGGYVAGSATLIDFLRNRAPTWVYTTGLSPADTAAALTAIALVKSEPERRTRLWQNVQYLHHCLDRDPRVKASHPPLPSDSPILCLAFADPASVLAASQQLRQQGIFAPAIRPPTVPTSRIRLTVMASHQPAQIEQLVQALGSVP